MAVETLYAHQQAAGFYKVSPPGGTYSDARDASIATYIIGPSQNNFFIGQHYQTGPPIYYSVWRQSLPFDCSDLSTNTIVLSAKLRLYGHTDRSDDEFDATIVEGPDIGVSALSTEDYNKLGDTSYGLLNTTALSVGSWNEFTINATGIAFINSRLQHGAINLGLRSGEDLGNVAPPADTLQQYGFYGYSSSYIPELVLTTSNWPNDIYPDDTVFPLAGKIDLATYGVISTYMTGLDADLSLITDGDGNLDLAIANWITWTGTSEKIAYDSGTSHVTVTTLEATSAITIAADLVTVDPTITTTGAAVDCTVANDALLSTTAYESIQASVSDDEVDFAASVAPTPADDWGYLYMDSTSGDFIMKTRDDGQAGTKTHILGDFSGM